MLYLMEPFVTGLSTVDVGGIFYAGVGEKSVWSIGDGRNGEWNVVDDVGAIIGAVVTADHDSIERGAEGDYGALDSAADK